MNCFLRNYGKLPLCLQDKTSGGVAGELALIEFVIETFTGEHVLMISLFYDIAVLHDENKVRFPDGGKPVGHDKPGLPVHDPVEGLLYLDFRTGVYVRSGLVQYQH